MNYFVRLYRGDQSYRSEWSEYLLVLICFFERLVAIKFVRADANKQRKKNVKFVDRYIIYKLIGRYYAI